MRWQNLTTDADDERRLPGYSDAAVVRTFDAPEALDTRFYEVRARSALNRVPEQSRMPFRFTINPYRGCSHACAYCAAGETPVLLADGRTRPLAEIRAGDAIYGTVRFDRYRRYVVTEVQDHWETIKSAYRITLEDGTELVASGDHRFLTSSRGWKYVTGTEQGCLRRPHLTFNNELMGTGRFAAPPEATVDYQRGYLCGMIRGDGHIGVVPPSRQVRARSDSHRFRLALTDLEALRRAREYLLNADVATNEFAFTASATRPMRAIATGVRARVDHIRELIRWPWSPSLDWCKGFLAGIFDAEGCYIRGVLRIANTDPAIIGRTVDCLRRVNFDITVEDRRLPNGLQNVRVRGGLREMLRFFHTVDPAITRKRTIDNVAMKSDSKLRVLAIEPLGVELPLYDITTGTGDFIANGVVSHNCFARPTHTYLDFNARRDFEREIVVKVNVPEVLRAELARPSWKREHVALGTNTDPYQWVEKRYRLMPPIWEALRDADTPCSVLTKSPLLLRDIELFKELAERMGFTANLSVPTLDERAWRATEPHTPHPRARLEAVAELNRAGIPTGVLVAPLMPGINDAPEQVEAILDVATQAGATHISGVPLHLRGEVRDIFFDWLRAQRPDLLERYERLYRRGAYVGRDEADRLGRLVRRGGRAQPRGAFRAPRKQAPRPDPEPRQSALF